MESQKIFIFGSTGYFGRHFSDFFKSKGWKVLSERVEITNLSAVREVLKKYSPDIVLNCAGKTGTPNVDWCETHKAETMSVNVTGALNIAITCDELKLYFAHLGSGCVYQGDNKSKGFAETDEPNFYGSFYSRTKLYSEKLLAEFNPLQLRVRIPIEGVSHPKNVIDKLLKYERVVCIENSFTIVEDFIPAAFELMERGERGIFNMTNVGFMDHKFLMEKYREIVAPSRKFEYMDLEGLKKVTLAARSNCVLNTDKREALGIHMPEIQGRIPEILNNYKKQKLSV